MDNISFQGQIRINRWKNLEQSTSVFKTTKAQDKLLSSVICEQPYNAVSESTRKFFLTLIEKITGKKLLSLEKGIYLSKSEIRVVDKNSELFSGEDIIIDLRH